MSWTQELDQSNSLMNNSELFCEQFISNQWSGVAVRYIYRDNIVIVVLTMCNLTLSSILQKPNKTPLECTRTLDEI